LGLLGAPFQSAYFFVTLHVIIVARTDLFYLVCDWQEAIDALRARRDWRLFWDALVEEGATELRCVLPFAELANVTYDLSIGETARGAVDFWASIADKLAPEVRRETEAYLTSVIPLTRLPDELGAISGITDPEFDVWTSLSPPTIERLVTQGESIDWAALEACAGDARIENAHVPDFDCFEGLLRGYHEFHRHCQRRHAGLLVLASF